MDLNEKQIMEILKMVNESDYGYLNLVVGDIEVTAIKRDVDPSLFIKSSSGEFGSKYVSASAEVKTVPIQHDEKTSVAKDTVTKGENERIGQKSDGYAEGHIIVKSPMLGTFFRRPSPNEDAFVEIGDVVEATDKVSLIEIMKLFHSIPAGHKGRIVDFLVYDGQMVEYDQPLFVIEPM